MHERGSVVLVTGAGRGIGRAIAEAFLASGAHVVLSGRNEDEMNGALAQISRPSGRAHARRLDVTEPAHIAKLAVFLASDAGKSTTGAIFDITAGFQL